MWKGENKVSVGGVMSTVLGINTDHKILENFKHCYNTYVNKRTVSVPLSLPLALLTASHIATKFHGNNEQSYNSAYTF